ncbi:hypothetical protein H0H93_008019 [Arthromyces matolae]|nr:hypothetical protein H0H93_008019 [Arthromyces matolae]
MSQALSRASKLVSFTLVSDFMSAEPIASLPFPWSQLEFLHLEVAVQFPTLYALLDQCHSLTSLRVALPSNNARYRLIPRPDFNPFLNLRRLKSLWIGCPAESAWVPNIGWHHLTHLDLSASNCEANILQSTLEQCVNLHKLIFVLPPAFPKRTLSLPVLKSLEFACTNRGASVKYLRTPCLEMLQIFRGEYLDPSSVVDLLSGCQLLCFAYNIGKQAGVPVTPFLPEILRLISPTVTLVSLPNVTFDTSILHDIGASILLPKVVDLRFIPGDIDAAVAMAKRWIERLNADSTCRMGMTIKASKFRPTRANFYEVHNEFPEIDGVSIVTETWGKDWHLTVQSYNQTKQDAHPYLINHTGLRKY